MKIGGITLDRLRDGRIVRLAGYGLAGFLSAGCCLEGRAPLAAGLLAALRPGREALAALAGGVAGSFVFLDFGPALRAAGVLVLIETILSAFRDTIWFQHTLFRPLTAAGTTLAVELAYALQMGLTRESVLRLLACTVLAGLLCHYCALLLREELDRMDDEQFRLFMRYHLATCERPDLLGVTSHALDIFRK